MENMKEINYTFIIPHKNCPNLLARCLKSIPRRDDIQIIVVDDNSDDDIVDFDNFPGFGEECVEVYFTKKSKGAGYARNVGLSHAKGRWLLFADADDFYASCLLEVLDHNLTENIDILFFNVFSNDESKMNRAYWINIQYNKYYKNLDINNIKYRIWAPWNKVFSRKFIISNQICFDEIPVGNDAIFSLTACYLTDRHKLIQDKLYCITYQPNSITYGKLDFKKKLNYAYVNIRINKFFSLRKLNKYRIEVFSLATLFKLLFEDGIKKTWEYLRYVSSEYSIFLSFSHTLHKYYRVIFS